jgi:two-component system, LytTR family, sensor kinase
MIKDKTLRRVFIPLLGLIIPYFSGIISYSSYSTLEVIVGYGFFIFVSFSIWTSCSWIHHKIRPLFKVNQNPFIKISSVCLISALFGASIAGFLSLIWFKISKENFSWTPLYKCMAFSALAVVIFTLIYEILFLSKERELDNKIVDQLDWERSKAELAILHNELDPHFMFNSLNTLSHLIISDPQTAHLFNSKLATVYKYFLINKERELISLHDEMEFIQNYFFLLKIRHDDKLQLQTKIDSTKEGTVMILPCALQILVENAIKHNEFSDAQPLLINIELNNHYLKVSNNIKSKPYLVTSTNIGLKNLSARYRIVCNKDIEVESINNCFQVKLPLI